jgi:hypothetical protein
MHFLILFFAFTNGLYTYDYYIVVVADSGGTLKSAFEENIFYTKIFYKIIKPKS